MLTRLRNAYQRHRGFILVLLLFVSFRMLAILVMRPGGFFADASDYDFYYAWGQLGAMGYRTFENLWSTYPPLFPTLMTPVFELSSRIPPWTDPRLFFHVLFGFWLLLFETGNLILIYRLAARLDNERLDAETGTLSPPHPVTLSLPPGLTAAILYALLFVPVYTLIGWFESMPLFFMLLGLELMFVGRTWGWIGSAVAAGLGFLTKFTPVLLVPIAIRWLGAKLSWRAAREEWFNRRSPGNLLRPTGYVTVFLGTVLSVGYWLTRNGTLELALSSFKVNAMRPPWQSLWAIIDGYYGFGLVQADMRNLLALETRHWDSRLPWGWITLGFMLLYLWLYTRRYDWSRVRTPVAFSAVSIIWLFLYSKGWSPQFLLWILAFIVILTPDLLGVILAIALSLINFVEADIFLLLVPDQHWLLAATVGARTLLLILLTGIFLAQIWPGEKRRAQMRKVSGVLAWLVMLAALIGALVATPRVASAYQDRRLAEHPCREAIEYLGTQAGGPASIILTEELDVWRDFYPWLRQDYHIRVLDTYSPIDEPPADVLAGELDELLGPQEVFWVTWQDESVAEATYFTRDDVYELDVQRLGACTVARVVRLNDEPLATVTTAGGPIQLLDVTIATGKDAPKVGEELNLVLYWMADAPVEASYTVFTQLFDPEGKMVAQQDNLPVNGLAPTDTWTPGAVIRDPYRLSIPADAPPGGYELYLGLYDGQGRRTLTLPDGSTTDHLTITVEVGE